MVAASKDLGNRLAASAASWRDIMASAAPSRTGAATAGADDPGSEAETLALNPDGSLAASLDIAYGSAPERAGDVLAEIADWVASLGDVDVPGPSASSSASAAREAAGRAAAAADVADLLDGVADRFEAALARAGAPGAEVAYDVDIKLGNARTGAPSAVDLDVSSADPRVSSGMLADALAAAADGAATDAAAAGVGLVTYVEEGVWACPVGPGLAAWACEHGEAISSAASAGAFACAVGAVAALLGAFDDDDEEDEEEDDEEYAALAGEPAAEEVQVRPPLWAMTAKQ